MMPFTAYHEGPLFPLNLFHSTYQEYPGEFGRQKYKSVILEPEKYHH